MKNVLLFLGILFVISNISESCVENVKSDGTYQVGPDGCLNEKNPDKSAT
jgi:hypothetical protein